MKKHISIILSGLLTVQLFGCSNTTKSSTHSEVTSTKEITSAYAMKGNDLQEFDLSFLKLENAEKNMLYSPLSIKYALAMLSEGSKNETKQEIDSVIGSYAPHDYTNSEHMSFANGIFIDEDMKDFISQSYIDTLSRKFHADVKTDPFENADQMNAWADEKTLGLIHNLLSDEDINDDTLFVLLNALAIDMNWENRIMHTPEEVFDYNVTYNHENYYDYIPMLWDESAYPYFEKDGKYIQATNIGSSANRYDLINELGEDNVRKTITDAYEAWLQSSNNFLNLQYDAGLVDRFMNEIQDNHNKVDTSTDFYFYTDDDVKAIAKDLKEYDGTQLQFVAIMPTQTSLQNYIDQMDAPSIQSVFDSLLDASDINSYEEGTITKIISGIPLFEYDYALSLKKDLQELGITSVFDSEKADLTGIAENTYVQTAEHKATITFSNDGIKASAVTVAGGGLGDAGGEFEYMFEVPVKLVDVVIDNPFLYFIRDKKTGEIWFAGTVYEPNEMPIIQYANEPVGKTRYTYTYDR